MKISKIFAGMSAAAIVASMMAALPVSADGETESGALSITTDISTGYVNLITTYEDEEKTTVKEQGVLDDAAVKYTDVYGVEFDLTFEDAEAAAAAAANAEDAKWAGGGLGFNSESTGWESHEWCLKTDDGEGNPVKEVTGAAVDAEAGTYSFTVLKEEPVFKDTDTYAGVWAQNWGDLKYSVANIKLLDAEGEVLVDFTQTPLIAQLAYAAGEGGWDGIVQQDWTSYTSFKLDEEASIQIKAPVNNTDATVGYQSEEQLFADNETQSSVWAQDENDNWYDTGEKTDKTFEFYNWYAADGTSITPNAIKFSDKDGEVIATVTLPEDAEEDATLEKITYAQIVDALDEDKALTDIYSVEYTLTAEGELDPATSGAIVWDGWAKDIRYNLNEEDEATETTIDDEGNTRTLVHGTLPTSTPVTVTDPFVFCIDFIDMYATYPNYVAELTGIVLDGEEFKFDADKVIGGHLEEDKGNYRLEIYNIYGDTKDASPIDLDAFKYSETMEVKFVVHEVEPEPEPEPEKKPTEQKPEEKPAEEKPDNPKTGAAALGLGAIALAGAAVVVSKKKD